MSGKKIPNSRFAKLAGQVSLSLQQFLRERKLYEGGKSEIQRHLEQYLARLHAWANSDDFLSIVAPRAGSRTWPAELKKKSAASSGPPEPGESFADNEILSLNKHLLITGESGCGKTVVIKRLINLLLADDIQGGTAMFPLLILPQEMEIGDDLFTEIARVLWINYTTTTKEADPGRLQKYLASAQHAGNQDYVKEFEHHFQGVSLSQLIAGFLSTAEVIIFVDGFDELISDAAEKVELQIRELGSTLRPPSMIVTSRPHCITLPESNFTELVPCGLTKSQAISMLDFYLNGEQYQHVKDAIGLNVSNLMPGKLVRLIHLALNDQLDSGEAEHLNMTEVLARQIDIFKSQFSQYRYEEVCQLNFEAMYTTRSNYFGNDTFALVEYRTDFIRKKDGKFQLTDKLLREVIISEYILEDKFGFQALQYGLEINCFPFAYAVAFSQQPTELFSNLVGVIRRGCRPDTEVAIYKRLLSALASFEIVFVAHQKLGVSFLRIISAANDADLTRLCTYWLNKYYVIRKGINSVLANYFVNSRRYKDGHVCYELSVDHVFNFYPYEIEVPVQLNKLLNANTVTKANNGSSY